MPVFTPIFAPVINQYSHQSPRQSSHQSSLEPTSQPIDGYKKISVSMAFWVAAFLFRCLETVEDDGAEQWRHLNRASLDGLAHIPPRLELD